MSSMKNDLNCLLSWRLNYPTRTSAVMPRFENILEVRRTKCHEFLGKSTEYILRICLELGRQPHLLNFFYPVTPKTAPPNYTLE